MSKPSAKTLSSPLFDRVTAHLRKLLSEVTQLPLQSINVEEPIEAFGVRAILRLTSTLEERVGWLPKTLYFEYSNLAALAGYFVEFHPEKLSLLLGIEGGENRPKAGGSDPGKSDVACPLSPADIRRYEGGENIAIVGLSCRFPYARNMYEFWENLRNGRDCIDEIPSDRWDHRLYFNEERNKPGATYGKWGGFIEGYDQFDPSFFNITPREAEMMDPQERIFLQCVYSAVEDAGYTPATLSWNNKTRIEQAVGVYVGLMFEEYNLFRGDILGSPASIANRISYFCSFHGPSLTVDTMCSSSLTAIHLACQSLKQGECGVAIAGGVNLTLHPNKYLMIARLKMASPKGRCKAFGEGGDGYVPGEGVGAIVMKPLANALADGDHIYGIIQGTAINQSGKTRAYFVPAPGPQAEVVGEACKTAGISPRIVTYVESHGTGTSLGDPIEIAGLTKVFDRHTKEKQFCAVGSVKSNIGHCESAAGIAGVIKVLLQMKYGQLAPTLHTERLNPNIRFEETPFVVQQKLGEWKRPVVEVEGGLREYPRIAGVSSFGAGGSNAHIVIEEHIEGSKEESEIPENDQRVALLLSARNEDRLREQAKQLIEAIETGRLGNDNLRDMAYTLQVGREAMEQRLGLTAATTAEATTKLKEYLQGDQGTEELFRGESKTNREFATAFRWDEDLGRALENWLKKRKWAKLLEFWVKGIEIDWSRAYTEGAKARRISMPTYPFAAERYWVEKFESSEGEGSRRRRLTETGPEQDKEALHPFVQKNRSRPGEQRFSSEFSGDEFFLAEHRVNGAKVMPGVAYLEMARAAVEQIWPERPPATLLELHNTVWVQPTVVNGNKEVEITLAVNHNDSADYEISTRETGQEVICCHGQVIWTDAPPPAKLDLEQLRVQTMQDAVEPGRLYATFARAGLVHGASFQSLTAVHQGSDQVLARLRLPKGAEHTWNSFVLHPSLLDGALQASAALLESPTQFSNETRLPFALESLRIALPCVQEMFAWVRYSPGSRAGDSVTKFDIDLCDPHGNVCIEMRGFSCRAMKNAERAAAEVPERIQPELTAFVPVWNPAPPEMRTMAVLPESVKILLVGKDPAYLSWIQDSHANVDSLVLEADAPLEIIQTQLKNRYFDHLLWIAPDVGDGKSASEDGWEQIIDQQKCGVLEIFRIAKALLHLGYGDRDLRWTIITGRTQQVRKDDEIQPAHAAIFGLVGSLAKEYPHWKLSLLDVDSLENVTAKECLAIPADQRGNGLARREQEWFLQEFAYAPVLPQSQSILYRQGGTYVVIGGAGGIGEVWTRFMIERYQANVVWIGRRPQDAAIEAKINSLKPLGRAPLYFSADATNLAALEKVCRDILDIYPAIHGVIHSAIVLRDQSIAGMEEPELMASLSVKTDVSVNIDKVFARQKLDFLLFFSSILSFTKAPGQSNYAAGCTFKDSFAQKLEQKKPYPVKTVNWGYWGQIGIVAGDFYSKAMERNGVGSITPREGMEFLEKFLGSELTQMALIKLIDAEAWKDIRFSEWLAHYSRSGASSSQQDQSGAVFKSSNHLIAAERPEDVITEVLLAEIVASSLVSLGLFQRGRRRLADLPLEKQPAPFYEQWLRSTIGYLQRRGLLDQDMTVTHDRPLPDLWREWEERKLASCVPSLLAQVRLLETCLKALPTILCGQQPATQVIFPESSMRLVEGIYWGHPVADHFNEILGDALFAWIENQLQHEERKLRILEIGAGTGATTATLLPRLQQFTVDEYCYTDVSKAFLMHAEEKFQPRFPALTTAIFDISRPLSSQSIPAGHYDVVIATNVLHATPNIRETLRNVKAALKNQGILLVNEINDWSLFTHLTFGLLEGWWLHEDTALRLPDSPGLTPARWREILAEEGFESIAFPAEESHRLGQQIIAASSNGWVRQRVSLHPALIVEHAPAAASDTGPIKAAAGIAASEETLRERSRSYFRELVASSMKMRTEQIDPRRAFAEYGLDSILVSQLTYKLRQEFSDITPTMFFEVTSIDQLVDYFLENKKQELVAVLAKRTTTPGQKSPVATRPQEASIPESQSKKIARRRLAGMTVQERVPEPAQNGPEADAVKSGVVDVAIIGLSGRYPRAKDLQEFWWNLSNGVDCITEVPRGRWKWEEYYDSEKGKLGKIYSKWGGFIDGIDEFDPQFFKIAPKEAKRMDPQERLFLECCYHAIEDAGYAPRNLGTPEEIGVFVGVMNSRYTVQPAHSSVANRVSYVLNFQGPSVAVDTACSSSLTAIHMALESIYSGAIRCAIAGGVNLIIDPVHYQLLSEMTMLSSGRHCKAFGENADGLIDAEGVGAVVLKPLPQAQKDGDHIYAVIKGSAINAGGKTNGFTVPSPNAQSRLVSRALKVANITADQVSYVEAHGTGTALGDPIEIAGLTRAFRQTSDKKQFCSIGSVKSNIGHCESAAGIAGLTKVLLQLQFEQLAPSLHSDVPNPEIDFSRTPFKVQKTLEKWRRPVSEVNGVMREVPRIAGISSFGAGGANAHVIVQEYIPPTVMRPVSSSQDTKAVIVLSARTEEQLKEKGRELLRMVEGVEGGRGGRRGGGGLREIAYTLQVGREGMEERVGVVVETMEELRGKLERWLKGELGEGKKEKGEEEIYRGRGKQREEAIERCGSEEEMRERVERWMEEKRYGKVVEEWVKGVEVEWGRLYGEGEGEERPGRISLPVYPFARERYWAEVGKGKKRGEGEGGEGEGGGEGLHPLLWRNTSDLREQRYETRFEGEEFYLRWHRVGAGGEGEGREGEGGGSRVLPGVVYLEMVREAMGRAWPEGRGELELRDVVWGEAVEVGAKVETVRIGLWVVEGREGEEIEYEIYSGEGEEEKVHSQGRGVWRERGGGEREEREERVEVEQLRKRMVAGRMEAVEVYEACARHGVSYGAGMKVVRELERGVGEVLARLQLPAEAEERWEEYVLHPSLMDGGLQALVGLEGELGEGGTWVPYAVERVRVVSGCRREMYAWVRRRGSGQGEGKGEGKGVQIDIDLCDLEGQVCVQMRGVRLCQWEEPATGIAGMETVSRKTDVVPEQEPVEIVLRAEANPGAAEVTREVRRKPSGIVLPAADRMRLENPVRGRRRKLFLSAGAGMVASGADRGERGGNSVGGEGGGVRVFAMGNGIYAIQISAEGGGVVEEELRQALGQMKQEPQLKVLTIRGIERGCGGEGREWTGVQRVYQELASFPYPVVGMVEGDALGRGLVGAGLCDLLVGNEEARYGAGEGKRGEEITGGEAGLLRERFGEGLEWMCGERGVRGRELRRQGWTCRMVKKEEVEREGRELAEELASKPQEALRVLKQHLGRRWVELVARLTGPEKEVVEKEEGEEERGERGREEDVVEWGAGGWEGEHVRVEDRGEGVSVVTLCRGGKEVRAAAELLPELEQVMGRIERSGKRAVVLASEYADFLPGEKTEQGEGQDAVEGFERVLLETELAVVAALESNAGGEGLLISQFCDGCIYSRRGIYTAAGAEERGALLYSHSLGKIAGREMVLSGGGYEGEELEERVRGLVAVEAGEVRRKAEEVAGWLAGMSRMRRREWKSWRAKMVRESLRGVRRRTTTTRANETRASEGRREREKREPWEGAREIALQSRVVRAIAHGNGVIEVKLEEREARNMFSAALVEGVKEVFGHIEEAGGDGDYRAVVVSGYDSYFACGGTKESLLEIQAGERKFTDEKIYQVGLECRLPVIAAMQGHGLGAGWVLGLMADVVLLSEESRYESAYMNYGFTPGAGATRVTGERMGEDLGRESLLTGRSYRGEELKERGVRVRVLGRRKVVEAALELAGEIAGRGGRRLEELKQRLRAGEREELEEVYGQELAMHEQTFVGQRVAREQIEKNFQQQQQVEQVKKKKEQGQGQGGSRDVQEEEVKSSLRKLLANELQMKAEEIDEDAQFIDLGLDSISGVTWVRKINEKYGTAMEATRIYSHATLKQLSGYVREEAGKLGRLRGEEKEDKGERAEQREGQRVGQRRRSTGGEAKGRMVKLASRRGQVKAGRAVKAGEGGEQNRQAIAVIGMAGKFPQARNLEEYWENLAQGRNCISRVGAERWDVNEYYQAGAAVAGKSNSQWLGAVEEYDRFDPLFFNLSPVEAESMDPQQRMFLESCWHSIEDGGYDARQLWGSRCGVFVGCANGDYQRLSREQGLSAQGFTGNAMSVLAGRIAYFLNLQGPCVSIDTACSSSLVALAQACDSLRGGSSDVALAGGVYVMAGPEMHIMTSQAGMLSAEGRCCSFDHRADGFVPGEGVGVVVLKRVEDAERDGDRIYGVIAGWGVNQDGKSNGITAPNPESQTRLEQEVYERYGIDAGKIQLVEAHGTGTRLGDPIEVEGLKKAFARYTEERQYCALGSVKSNIGHCLTAAGIAGVIKVLLALEHRQLPPTINFERLNEHIELENSPFYVNTRLQEWKRKGEEGRLAAVSSFGFSGTNAHVVVGEYGRPEQGGSGDEVEKIEDGERAVARIVPLSARTSEQLKQKAQELLRYIDRKGGELELAGVAYTLAVGRMGMEERLAVVANSVEQLREKLAAYVEGEGEKEVVELYTGQVRKNKESLGVISQDEEVKAAIVERCIAGQKLTRLAELWVRGLELDWKQLWRENKPQRIRLPGYPFARHRYWIEKHKLENTTREEMVAAVLHPLLHRNTSDLEQQRYSSTFTGEEFFLAHHRVRTATGKEERILPGVAYLEMARAAIENSFTNKPESSILEMHDTVWLRSGLVTGPKQFSIAIFEEDDDSLGYEVYSLSAEQKVMHCQGHATFTHHSPLARLDLESLKGQMTHAKLECSRIYTMLETMGLCYGPAHQGIVAIHLGDKQLLAQLRLPAIVERHQNAYLLNPSIMDSALQSSMGLLVDLDHLPNQPSVPFLLESLQIFSGCTKEMFAWVRYSDGISSRDKVKTVDIDLCDQHGNICVQMRKLVSRALDKETRPASRNGAIDDEANLPGDDFFDSSFYEKLIADVVNHEMSVDQAVELA